MGLLKIACAVLLVAALAPATAAADSIVYIKDGNVWLAAPDGTRQTQITSDGGYESPSQADDGTIVAVRKTDENGYHNRRLYRMDRTGHLLNPPVESVPVNASTYIGPLGATVSPDGQRVAYFYFDNGPFGGGGDPEVSISYSTRNTPIGEIGNPGPYMNPNWLDNNTLLLFSPPGYQYDVHTDVLGSGQDPVWFGDDSDSIAAGGDVSPDGTRLVAGIDAHIHLYQLNGPPPAAPTPACQFDGPAGAFHPRPNWSSDGRMLTWAEDDGVHVATVNSLSPCDAQTSTTPLIPGADSPFFGKADPPGTTSVSTPLTFSLSAPKPGKLAKVLAKGYAITVSCSMHCAAGGQLKMGKKVVAQGYKTGGPGKVKVVLKFSKKSKAALGKKKTVALKLLATAADDSGNTAPVVTKKLTLRR